MNKEDNKTLSSHICIFQFQVKIYNLVQIKPCTIQNLKKYIYLLARNDATLFDW